MPSPPVGIAAHRELRRRHQEETQQRVALLADVAQMPAFSARSSPRGLLLGTERAAPMAHKKKSKEGVAERLSLLSPIFPEIQRHLESPLPHVGKDDLLDAAAAAWTALRLCKGEARRVCEPERDDEGLEVAIWY